MTVYLKINKIIFNETHWPTDDRQKGILIASDAFPKAVRYVIKADSLIILSGNNGVFCFDIDKGELFLGEVLEIVKCYRNNK